MARHWALFLEPGLERVGPTEWGRREVPCLWGSVGQRRLGLALSWAPTPGVARRPGRATPGAGAPETPTQNGAGGSSVVSQ